MNRRLCLPHFRGGDNAPAAERARPFCRRRDACTTSRANRISEDPPRRSRRHLFRRQGGRPVSLAGSRRPARRRRWPIGWRPRTRSRSRYLESIPERESIRRRLTELWNFAAVCAAPSRQAGDTTYEERRPAEPVGALRDGLAGRPSRGRCSIRTRGRRTARSPWAGWASATTAATWPTAAPRPAPIGPPGTSGDRLRQDRCPTNCNGPSSSQASWTKDGKGFFYSRYEEPKKGAEFQALNFNNKLFYHRLGTPQSDDVLVYYRPEHPDWQYDGVVTEDGR